MDYGKTAANVLELVGGKENLIISEKDLNLMSFKDYTKKICE